MSEAWIINASPTIVLGRIGRLELLDSLHSTVLVPEAVITEIRAGLTNDSYAGTTLQWAMRHHLENRQIPISIAMWGLGAGESQVLSHCLEIPHIAILDDLAARRCAKAHQIRLMGTLGVILAAKKKGLIPLARPTIEQAMSAGLYLDNRLVADVLASIDE